MTSTSMTDGRFGSANQTTSGQRKFTNGPQEVIAAARRLLDEGQQSQGRVASLSRTDMFMNKIEKIKRRIVVERAKDDGDDEFKIREFEDQLWSKYGLIGEIVPDELLKECQRRLREATPGSRSEMDMKEELEAVDYIHRIRKCQSYSFSRLYAPGRWTEATHVRPDISPDALSKGTRFWALIIGNNDYPGAPLSGCINDAFLILGHLRQYLHVPEDHICMLQNVDRKTMIDALYNLRDDVRIKPGDTIMIHFSGHGSSYDPRASNYFASFASQVGSIEALCPVDRGDSVPDISERELNSFLTELQAAKGSKIIVILDCCHSGGAVRAFEDSEAIRYIPPLRNGDALKMMFEAADGNPRRSSNVPTNSSEVWVPDLTSFVLLAACQDFQYAYEARFEEAINRNVVELAKRAIGSGGPRRGGRYGRFTWALVKVLESEMAQTATYESLIALIGPLGPLQVPLAVGTRRKARLWFEG